MLTFANCLLVARTVLFALMAALSGAAFAAPSSAIEPPAASEAKQRHARLGSILSGVVAAYERDLQSASSGDPKALAAGAAVRDAASRSAAGRAPMSQGASVAVTFRIDDPSKIEALTRFLKESGGDPRNVGEDYVEAYVPVALLVDASQQPGVRRVQAIIPPRPKRGPVTSQGVAVHGADRWHALGITGQGIKVGVLDTGFSGFRALMGSELPASVVARCYREMGRYTSDLEDCKNELFEGDVHGTAVSETLLDVAPDVSLYIADPETKGDLKNTVDWMAAQGVQVINFSQSWEWDGPGDGTSPFSDSPLNTADAAIEKGAVWVTAAGNEADRIWFGAFGDLDDDGYHEFDDDPQRDICVAPGGRVLPEAVCRRARNERVCSANIAGSISVQLRWQGQWGSGARLADLDLYVYEWWGDGPGFQPLAKSEVDQNAPGMEVPIEYLEYEGDDDTLCVFVRRSDSRPVADPDWIQVLVLGGQALGGNEYTRWGSIGNPAESANPGLLAVGAAYYSSHEQAIEGFSSRGPAPDGRLKPDIVGVDGTVSAAWGSSFQGTSNATPHVAGLAALVRQAYPGYGPHEVASYLKRNASPRDREDWVLQDPLPHPNNVWGYGLAGLPPLHGWHSERMVAGEGDRRLPLSRYFPAADADATFEAASSDPRLLAVAVRQGAVVLTPLGEGWTTVTLRARLGDGSYQTVLIATSVRANHAPEAAAELPELALAVGETRTVDIAGAFVDPDGDWLTYSAWSSDESVATASAFGTQLRVRGEGVGVAEIGLRATDVGRLSATRRLPATVGPALTLADAEAAEGATARLAVELSMPRATATTFRWRVVADADTTTADADAGEHSDASGETTIPAGETSTEIEVRIVDDEEIEPAREWFEVVIEAPADGCCGLRRARARVAVLEGVCDRTPAVADALRGDAACTAPTPAALTSHIRLAVTDAVTLRAGDLQGLAGLQWLDLSGNDLATLPDGAFAGAEGLRELDLSGNALTTLPPQPFAALPRLRVLDLSGNAFATLPTGLFAGLSLREASLADNPGAPFALAAELARTDADPWADGPATVEARLPAGAPFPMRLPLTAAPVADGLPTMLDIPAGATAAEPFAASAPPAGVLALRTGAATLPPPVCGAEWPFRPCFRGLAPMPGPALTLFRRPPRALPAPEPEALVGDDLRLALTSLIAAGDGALRWQATSSDESVATVRVVGGDLLVEPELGAEGTTEIVLVARDSAGLTATVRFEVRVEFYAATRQSAGWRNALRTLTPAAL